MDLRDNLLITAGMRAAYLDSFLAIELPFGVEGEDDVALFISHAVDDYLDPTNETEECFDIYIEERLLNVFGRD